MTLELQTQTLNQALECDREVQLVQFRERDTNRLGHSLNAEGGTAAPREIPRPRTRAGSQRFRSFLMLESLRGPFHDTNVAPKEIEDTQAASAVSKFNSVSGLPSLWKIDLSEPTNLFPLRHRGRQGRVNLGESLKPYHSAHRTHALDFGLCPRDLSLIPIEDANRHTDPESDRVVILNPLVFELRRDIPPCVRASQIHVRPRLLERRLGRRPQRRARRRIAEAGSE